jgi:UDP-N-acetylglucosamine 3-dehydrogenase
MIKAAVIGVGNMGRNHARVYSELAKVKLVGVADTATKTSKKVAAEFHTEYFRDYQTMLATAGPDMVSICVPTFMHYQVAKTCLQHNIHVLVEKPITMDVKQAEELLAIANKQQLCLLVGHIERHNPAVQKVKQLIEQGDLGEVTAITMRRVGGFPPQIKDADIVVDLAIHDIDIANYLLGRLPTKVQINRQRNHIRRRADSVELFMQYPNHKRSPSAYIQANWITPIKIRQLAITGTEGYLEMDYISQKIDFYKSRYIKDLQIPTDDFAEFVLRFSEPDYQKIKVEKKEPLKQELGYFINCVDKNELPDSQYAVEALKIALTT